MSTQVLIKNLFSINKNISTLKYALSNNIYKQNQFTSLKKTTERDSKRIDQIMEVSNVNLVSLIYLKPKFIHIHLLTYCNLSLYHIYRPLLLKKHISDH
ncbi:hypothetical protein DFA_06243 [Cavenderia fasciculata]|uniref:Uncharacterized protein n=1 Tax=Cavenderia fasciculata TaxID=261658 RepID=F4PKI0_CACFS|nr:uncharacterized protein DFA_06243 [Cavenderia fasciculata]EGG24104.1 hypothetical protein DFA_06243 [Cavenderia fasciculata]|eukprot:XP_004361955.1 hypothetical protein DFA_06243 [Cavenderia fasciculata]